MSKKYNLYQVDSFTKEKFSGNPAGVITNAQGLSEGDMQRIARELNNSETAFIFQPVEDGYDVHVRFFTPTHEVPICGHATIAAHYVRAIENNLGSSRVLHKTGAGILPVDVVKDDNDYKIVMTQGAISFEEPITAAPLEQIVRALNLEKDDLINSFPVQIVSTGHSKVMVGIKKVDALHQLAPNMELLVKASQEIGCNGFYVFTMDHDADVLVHGRMFAPAIGINEDPVTGNANGPLGAYLVHHQLVKHDSRLFRFKAMQGEVIKRAGTVFVEVDIHNQQPQQVRIAGHAVVVFKTELTVF